jgi:hypothetical protein
MASGKSVLVDSFREFGGGDLRDVWLFDQTHHESLFVREDVAANLEDVVVSRYVENERYGYITCDTYSMLHYATYEYTIRGFDEYEQFRTFLQNGDEFKVGVFASFDQRTGGRDYQELQRQLDEVVADYSISAFEPEPTAD